MDGVGSCHTLLFSGHLQPDSIPENSYLKSLPYPSIFGSLATELVKSILSDMVVAIPFYFRVTCNTSMGSLLSSGRSCHTLLFSGHLQLCCHVVSMKCYRCHTLLFSGHLQLKCYTIGKPGNLVAIPFYFRVTCNYTYLMVIMSITCCHTLLFSGHLQHR